MFSTATRVSRFGTCAQMPRRVAMRASTPENEEKSNVEKAIPEPVYEAAVKDTVEKRVDQLVHENSPKSDSVMTIQRAQTFSGAGPEVINGRLAMLGFTAALGAELATGTTAFEQFKIAPGLVLGTVFVITAASWLPLFKGAKKQEEGSFKWRSELVNGRAAMIGLAILFATEAMTGHPLFTQI